MWLQACLNGSRTLTEHHAVPLTPEALAADALSVLEAGADALHIHPRDASGRESLEPEPVAAVLRAIREACPGMPVGISTAEAIGPDITKRLASIQAWTILPDYVSVNLADFPWLRLLLEPWETNPEAANAVVDTIESVLGNT